MVSLCVVVCYVKMQVSRPSRTLPNSAITLNQTTLASPSGACVWCGGMFQISVPFSHISPFAYQQHSLGCALGWPEIPRARGRQHRTPWPHCSALAQLQGQIPPKAGRGAQRAMPCSGPGARSPSWEAQLSVREYTDEAWKPRTQK